ncbi:23S rRNA (adenine(2030)-N(6))-methyltransferase RlmJ [Ningiella sp. W23]|uniref:23S rRNA (adenine(2030)-N(6))-methyltransferase RlmJ n=1 Tax=Ningiella sp. W23 TaxID=3023715 RepID=UPI003757E7F7
MFNEVSKALLSYQHIYHVGNHADVFKHLVLSCLLAKFKAKPKPFFALDTHAGQGVYQLSNLPANADIQAFQTLLSYWREAKIRPTGADGIDDYVSLIADFAEQGIYLGSCALMNQLAREQDSVHLNELSANTFAILRRSIRQLIAQSNTTLPTPHFHQRDAFEILNALMPPKPNRGFVIIDPPYEQALEYQDVSSSVQKALLKWPNGCFVIWYPLLSPRRINRKTQALEDNPKAGMADQMFKSFKQFLSTQNADTSSRINSAMLCAEFAVSDASDKLGMYGSGMCIINPPYQFEQSVKSVLALLSASLLEKKCEIHASAKHFKRDYTAGVSAQWYVVST